MAALVSAAVIVVTIPLSLLRSRPQARPVTGESAPATFVGSAAVAYAIKLAGQLSEDKIIVINLSGRGDKDMGIVANALGVAL